MNMEAKLRGLRERHRVRTAERRQRDNAILELFAQKDRQLGKDMARALSVNILTIRRAIYRLRESGHRIGGAKGYGYVYFGGPK
ncbi:HTH domain-containing protein [Bacillus sp. PR5]|nr:HTH domain-containing protein [Bacillus sp. PR5]